jgi:hypothetical protein
VFGYQQKLWVFLLTAFTEVASLSSPEAMEISWLSSGKPEILNHYNPVNPV